MGVEAAQQAVTVEEAVVMDWAGEVEVTLLWGVVIHSADSQGVASVRDSGGCEASSGRFSGRGDDGRFRAGGRGRDFAFHDGRFHNRFFAHDRFFRRHHRFVSNFAFVGFGFPDWYSNYDDSYSDDYPNNDGEPGYDGQYFD